MSERPERPHNWTPPPPDDALEPYIDPDAPPPIPGQLLEKLPTGQAGSFALPAGADGLRAHAAVALTRGFVLVGEAQREQAHQWIGLTARAGSGSVRELGSISAAIGDGQGGALLVGHVRTDAADQEGTRGWFGALDAKGKLTREQVYDHGQAPAEAGFVDVPAKPSLFAVELEGADPLRTIEAVVDLGESGLFVLGLAKRERTLPHHQVFALGFDRMGKVRWTRLLEHFRAIEIYAGTTNPKQPGVAHFVLRIPVAGGEDRSALAWLEISPGMDGSMIARQLAGTEGWASAGFVADGPDGVAIMAYTQTPSGIDWRTLPLHHAYRR